jgi:hypothetical protein
MPEASRGCRPFLAPKLNHRRGNRDKTFLPLAFPRRLVSITLLLEQMQRLVAYLIRNSRLVLDVEDIPTIFST